MADTTTTNYSLTKPEVGASEDTWGTKLNTNLDTIDGQMKTNADAASSASSAASSAQTTADAALPKAGGTMTGALNFGDNVKAQFGASNDLEIYHDGSNSYITDAGTGNLRIQGDNILFYNAAGTEVKGQFNSNSACELYYDNSSKLVTTSTGVDVTGGVLSTTGWFGLDATDNIQFSNNAYMDVRINNASRVRVEADGDLHADGDVIAYSTTISDERLKENIVGIDEALSKVAQLNGYTFTYKADGKISAGVIAQEVEKVLPEAVSEKELPLKADDGQEYKVVNYDALHGLLIEAIKELKAEIEVLKGAK